MMVHNFICDLGAWWTVKKPHVMGDSVPCFWMWMEDGKIFDREIILVCSDLWSVWICERNSSSVSLAQEIINYGCSQPALVLNMLYVDEWKETHFMTNMYTDNLKRSVFSRAFWCEYFWYLCMNGVGNVNGCLSNPNYDLLYLFFHIITLFHLFLVSPSSSSFFFQNKLLCTKVRGQKFL